MSSILVKPEPGGVLLIIDTERARVAIKLPEQAFESMVMTVADHPGKVFRYETTRETPIPWIGD